MRKTNKRKVLKNIFSIFLFVPSLSLLSKPAKAKIKKNDLKKRICQMSGVSNNLTIKPPQLKKKPPNKTSRYPGTSYINFMLVFL